MIPAYYILLHTCPPYGPNAYPRSEINVNFGLGLKLEEEPKNLQFELSVDDQAENPLDFPPLDFHDAYDGPPLCSARMVKVLNDVGVANIDYYPAKVNYKPDRKLKLEYYAANIVGTISCLDLDKSVYEADANGFIDDVTKLKFDESKCSGEKIARLNELIFLVMISKEVKDAIESANLTGIRIITDEEWLPGMI